MSTAMKVLLMTLIVCRATPGYAQNPSSVMNEPDKFAWDLFLSVTRQAPGHPKQVIWQTWIEQNLIFNKPCATPVWPDSPPGEPTFRKSPLLAMINRDSMSADAFPTNQGNYQEVRFNKVAFDYILANNLWYQEGILATASHKAINFPPESIIVKSEWAPIDDNQKDTYYWIVHQPKPGQTDSKPEPILLGLVAFHIISKAIPNWSWHTWEHVDNAGRCDFIGCQDNYGSEPAYIKPHRDNGLKYEPGILKPVLLKRFQSAGIKKIFRHFRLKGSQTNFTDSKGRPTLLANSVMEPGFGYASSCITCHAMATLGQPGPLSKGNGQQLNFTKSNNPFESFVGVPNPAWFDRKNAGLPVKEIPIVYQTDFLWSMPSLALTRSDCGGQTGSGN